MTPLREAGHQVGGLHGQAETPGARFRERFNARSVFSDLEHEASLRQANTDPGPDGIYRDRTAVFDRIPPSGDR